MTVLQWRTIWPICNADTHFGQIKCLFSAAAASATNESQGDALREKLSKSTQFCNNVASLWDCFTKKTLTWSHFAGSQLNGHIIAHITVWGHLGKHQLMHILCIFLVFSRKYGPATIFITTTRQLGLLLILSVNRCSYKRQCFKKIVFPFPLSTRKTNCRLEMLLCCKIMRDFSPKKTWAIIQPFPIWYWRFIGMMGHHLGVNQSRNNRKF